jgi:hypothetical protein
MTQMLEEAIRVVKELPALGQDAIASAMLAEVEDERRWAEAFARSHDVLEALAREALEEHRAGRTLPLDPERM